MKTSLYNCSASTSFDRLEFAVNGGIGAKPLQYGHCAGSSKNPIPPNIPLVSTIKQCPDYRGFFVGAALPALLVGESWLPERIDELSILSVRWGRGVSQPRRTGRDDKWGYTTVTGLSSKADRANRLSLHRAKSENARTGSGTGLVGKVTPYPSIRLAVS